MHKRESGSLAAALMARAGPGARSAQIAETLVKLWEEIDMALRPVIGTQGVAALLKRSIQLASRSHPWLSRHEEGADVLTGLAALESAVLQQADVESAVAACGDLLETFYVLLSTLIGPSLTDRLLHGVWTPLSNATPDQDFPTP